jgi:hypothetical protein
MRSRPSASPSQPLRGLAIVALALAALLVVATPASAAKIFYSGKETGDTEGPRVRVSFTVQGPERGGFIRFKDAKVKDFIASRITLDCGDAVSHGLVFLFQDSYDVGRDGDWEGEEGGGPVSGQMSGQFKGGDHDAAGFFHYRTRGECTSERVHWKARNITAR